MFDPKVSFFQRDDGVSIAYAQMGEGPPLVMVPGWVSHVELVSGPAQRPFLEQLSQHFRVITFDKHGTGLSDRERTEFTLDSEVRDLEALVDHLQLSTFVLFAMSEGGPAVIRYTIDHAERVERLIFFASFANGRTMSSKEFQTSFTGLVESSWGFASQAFADLFAPGGDAATMENMARSQRKAASRDVAAGILRLIYCTDVRGLLSGITAPTLIVHRTRDRTVPMRCGRELAIGIPHARFVALEGNQHLPGFGDVDGLVRAFLEFLLDDPAEVDRHFAVIHGSTIESSSNSAASNALRTLLFTDLEGHTAMMSRLGDARGRDVLREHERMTREALAAHGGQEVKTMGDGFMASFGSAQRALECAVALQRAAAGGIGGEALSIRAGINAGEPIAEDDDLFGSSVIAAARIAGKASGGQVLVSDVVRQLVAGKGFLFSDTGMHDLKGLEEPVRLWELRWERA